eukprot:1777910-Prymnesium_polylepis.1
MVRCEMKAFQPSTPSSTRCHRNYPPTPTCRKPDAVAVTVPSVRHRRKSHTASRPNGQPPGRRAVAYYVLVHIVINAFSSLAQQAEALSGPRAAIVCDRAGLATLVLVECSLLVA